MTELPTSFGKYYLTEKLATGGMAEIYLAKIIGPGGFEKPLVIKQILPRLSGQRHFVDLFVAEAKTLVTLTHGNIVPVYELGVIDDTYFIAMDYIDGPTLYRLTETMARREAKMEPNIAAWITARMLEGLDYAHRKGEGVIHRDLSPRNVMLSRDGEVKLVDFGIAVTLGDPGESDARESAPTGSFPYMSPEQVRREPLTGQTDLFSVGVLLWEMLTGRRLFARADADATLAAVVDGEIPRPSTVRPEVPARLDDVVMRALERDRGARWPNAADMLAALNKYLYSLDETPGPRDIGALVAKFCPPETRRLPTHLEAIAHDVLSPEPLGGDDSAPIERPAASGPSTAVIPRDAQAKGRPPRQKSFATNVGLQAILDRSADPLPRFDELSGGHRTEEKSDILPRFDEVSGGVRTEEKSDLLPRFDAIEDKPTKDDRPPAERVPGAFAADTDIDAKPLAARRTERASSEKGLSPTTQPPARRSRPMNTVDDAAEEPPERPLRRTPRSIRTPTADGSTALPGEVPVVAMASPERTAIDAQPLGSQGSPGNFDATKVLRQAPSRAILILAGFGGLALAIGAIVIFFQNRARVLASGDAGMDAPIDAYTHVFKTDDATVEVVTPPMIDAGDPPTVIDAGEPARDAGRTSAPATHDARRAEVPTARPDAGVATDGPAARGTATLQVGADPWGEIYVDGKSMGRTPKELTVPAGRHTIEVVFPAETPPRKQTFAVDLANGETKPLQADFSH